MQISERIKRLKAQNMIEFVFILPLLLFITLVIFEVALFWQETNAIYNLNNEINANLALIDTTNNMQLGVKCIAATKALEILKKKDSGISLSSNNYTEEILDGQAPFALYKYHTPNSITDNNGANKPQIALWIDCRNPFEEGFTSQIEFFHKTVVIKATIPRFDGGEKIEIIPENIFISSPKLSTMRHY